MAEGQPVLGQQRLGLGAAQPGLEGRGHRDGVDVEQPVHPHQVEAEHAGEALARGRQPAGDRRAAAERHHGDVVLDRDREHRRDLVVRRRGGRRRRGRRVRSPARARSRSGVDLPRVRSRRVASSVSTCVGAERRAQLVEQRPRRGRTRGAAASSTAGRSSSAEGQLDQRRARRRGGRSAAAGSPQRVGCISVLGVGWSCVTV